MMVIKLYAYVHVDALHEVMCVPSTLKNETEQRLTNTYTQAN